MIDAPFKIGDVYWYPDTFADQESVTCPMCCGNKTVLVTIGTGEIYEVECEECRAGWKGPQGYTNQWNHTPSAKRFEIASVEEWRADRWRVKATTGRVVYFDELCATKKEALAKATKRAAEQMDRNMESQRKKKYGKVSTWTIQYHLKQIKEHERQADWHREKVKLKKGKK